MDQKQAQAWLLALLSKNLKIDPKGIQPDVMLSEYGMDSMQAVMLSGEISELTGQEVPPNILYERPTVHELAAYMEELCSSP